jgi:O-antigen/teichoic acid export membrane protein
MAAQELIFAFGLSALSLTVLRYRDALERGEGVERFRRGEAALLYGSIVAQAAAVWLVLPLFGRATPELLAAAMLYIVTRSLLVYFAERARAGGAIGCYTLAQVAGPVGGFLLALALTSRFGATPAAALLGYGVVQCVALPLVWARAGATWRPAAPTPDLVDPLWRYGAPLLLSSLLTWVSLNGVRLVVDAMQGAVALGLMSVGWGLGQRISATVAMIVTAAAFPLAVKSFNNGDRDGAQDQLAQNGALLIALLAPAAAGLILVNAPLVHLLVGAPYWSAAIATLPLATLAGMLRNARVHYADQIYLLHERTGWLLVITLVEAVATLVGAAAGGWTGGVVGAVAGVLVAHAAVAVLVFAQGVAMLGLRVRWADLGRIAAATAAMSLVVWAPPPASSALELAAVVALGAAVYAACLMALLPDIVGRLRRAAG